MPAYTKVQQGGGAYNTAGYYDPTQDAADANNAQRRAKAAADQRFRDQQSYDGQQFDAQRTQQMQAAPQYGRGSFGATRNDPMSYGAQLDKRFFEQQSATAAQEAASRNEYLRNTLAGWRNDPTAYEAALRIPTRGDVQTDNWRREAMAQFQNERGATADQRRAWASEMEVNPLDADFQQAIGGNDAAWKAYSTKATRAKQAKDMRLTGDFWDRARNDMSDGDWATLMQREQAERRQMGNQSGVPQAAVRDTRQPNTMRTFSQIADEVQEDYSGGLGNYGGMRMYGEQAPRDGVARRNAAAVNDEFRAGQAAEGRSEYDRILSQQRAAGGMGNSRQQQDAWGVIDQRKQQLMQAGVMADAPEFQTAMQSVNDTDWTRNLRLAARKQDMKGVALPSYYTDRIGDMEDDDWSRLVSAYRPTKQAPRRTTNPMISH